MHAEAYVAFLGDAHRLLNTSLELKPTIEHVLQLGLPRFADWMQVDLFDDHGVLRTFATQHKDPDMQRYCARAEGDAHFDLSGPGGIPYVAREGKTDLLTVVDDIVIDRGVPDPSERAMYRAWGTRSAIVVPLRAHNRLIGTLCMVSAQPGRYTQDDVPFAEEFGNRAALAIENARAYEREHRVANTLQHAILPERLPLIPGIAFDRTYLAGAKEAEVGGDWYDAFMLHDGRVVVSMGDVGGKGLHAAVLMSEMRHAIRAGALDERVTPSDVLHGANRLLQLSGASLIVTALVAFIDPASLHMTYASAGHPGFVYCDASGHARVLPTDGVPLGIDFSDPPQVFEHELELGSLLVGYTDGILEFDRDLIAAEASLVAAVASAQAAHTMNAASSIAAAVLGDRPRTDDIAILTVRFDNRPLQAIDVRLPATPSSAALVRREIDRFAAGSELDHATLFALQIAVGEATINAIEHAYTGAGEFSVKLERLGDGIVAAIDDFGAWRPGRPSDDPPLERERGRGFVLMDGFARDVRVHRRPTGTSVRFVVPLEASA